MKLKTLFMTIGLGFWMNAAQATPAPAHGAVQRGDLVTTLGQQGSFKTLAAALKATDLITTLESNGPFTVLAPTDAAFAKLGR